ncbi:MAG: autotransporter-associated beta strand repeat-containing protein, partial [Akkermansia sp.]|nr:autotransporter-associated beta strand repeat-containing protein [Akkermansia sp.]
MVIKFSPEYGAYIASDYLYDDSTLNKNRIKLVSRVTYLKTPSGLDEMLEDYYNDKTLHWTGTSEGGKWESSSKMIGMNHHLATPADGWQKECTGGEKTIYAHAYFTEAEESKMNFVFDSQVGTSGKLVRNRVVQIDDDLKVGRVTVNAASDYHFGGQGSLKAKELSIAGNLTIGAYDRAWESDDVAGSLTIYNTPIAISGSLTLSQLDKSSATLQNCDVTLSGGVLWCGGMTLVRVDEFGSVHMGTFEYNAIESNMQMKDSTLRVLGSGTLGCMIDLAGNAFDYATWAMSDKKELNNLFFYYVASNNKWVEGDVDTYRYDYKLTNANIESNAGALKEEPLYLSGSTLTITSYAASTDTLLIGSSSGNLADSGAEIVLDEGGSSTIQTDSVSLMTMPTEETYLGRGTSITTPELLVSGTSTLTNEGRISGGIVVEEDAMLRGSGTFAGTTVQAGGSLMVGSNPGAPVYEALTLQTGSELIFCVDGTKAATAEKQGWGSCTHSLLTVTDAAGLTVEAGTVVNVGCSLDFLNASELGEEQTLTLVQLSGEAGADLLAALQSGTQFKLDNADDSMEELSTVGALVHSATWSQGADNTLTLSFIVSSMMEDALVWSNASADGKWNTSSLNWTGDSPYADGCNVAFYQGGSIEIDSDITPGGMVVSTPDDMVWSGAGHLLGSGSLTKEGSGELRISMSNTDYSGNVEVRGGTLTTGADYALGSAWIEVKNATLDLGDKASNNTVLVYGKSTLRGASGLKAACLGEGSELTSPDGLSVGVDATLTSLGAATYVGDLTLAGGTVALGGLLSIEGDLVFAKGSSTKLDITDSAFVGYGNYTLAMVTGDVVGLDATSVDLSILGGGELLYKESTGALVLKMSSVLEWQNKAKTTWAQGCGGWVDEDGVTSDFNNNDVVVFRKGTVSITGAVNPGRVYVDTAQTVTFKTTYQKKTGQYSGIISGDCAIEKSGKGTLRMNDGNTYSGGTILKAGTLTATGISSFGSGDISIMGGTLNLASKAVANAITLVGEASIKGGAKYVGEFTMTDDSELLKGSVVNVAETATLAGGELGGTLSGTGTVYVTGDVELESTGKLTTSGLNITGALNVGSKGLTMNAKSSAISISGGTLASEGKLSAASFTMVGGALDVSNAKPMTVTLTGVADLSAGATVDLYGAFTATDLDMDNATFTLSMDDGYVNQPKPQNITLKDKNATSELTNGSTLDVMGSMSVAGGVKLSGSTLSLHDWDEAQ